MKFKHQPVLFLFFSFLLSISFVSFSKAESKSNNMTYITISAVGDCTLGTNESQKNLPNFNKEYQKQKDSAYFFELVSPIFEEDDLTIANFEGTLTTSNTRADKQFAFKGSPAYAKILTDGSIEVVNLANNHSSDYGAKSYTDTISILNNNHILTFGEGKIAVKNIKGIRIGFVGVNGLREYSAMSMLEKGIKQCKIKQCDLILVNFHWGTEGTYEPTKKQTNLAYAAVDLGADLVLGHHPHVLQGMEYYKNAWIVYSLGNFCFGGNTNPKDKDTMIFQQTFSFYSGKKLNTKKAKIIPCSISSVRNRNNFQPKPLTGSDKSRLIKKINQMCRKWNITFDTSGESAS